MIDEWPEDELEALVEWLREARRGHGGGMRLGETSFTDEEVEGGAPAKQISFEQLRRILDEAPLDDEPETEDELEALRESLASKPEDRISHADLMKRLGL